MKKIIFILMILGILILAGCGSDKETDSNTTIENNITDVNTGIENTEIETSTTELEEKETEEIAIEIDLLEDKDLNLFIIKRGIGKYNYKSADEFENSEMYGYTIAGFSGKYEYKNTNALVNIIFSNDYPKIIREIHNDDSFESIDTEDFNIQEGKVYYNPYENFYIWPSQGYLVKIDNSIGFDLLDKYLKENPSSEIIENNKDEFEIELTTTDITLIRNNQIYYITAEKTSSRRIDIDINGYKAVMEELEEKIVGELKVKVISVSDSRIKLEIKESLIDLKTFYLDLEETVTYDDSTIILKSYNDNSDEVSLFIDNKEYRLEDGEKKNLENFKIEARNFIVNTIGEDKVNIELLVWKED